VSADCFSDKSKLEDNIFELAYSMIAPAMPTWGNMHQEAWQKVRDFSFGAGIINDRAKPRREKKGCYGPISSRENRNGLLADFGFRSCKMVQAS